MFHFTAMSDLPVRFECQGHWLQGIVHSPEKPARRGVLVVVGGPQYRVGSHRQFTLLGRSLSERGIPVMRFDYRGMGDSEGDLGVPEPCEHLADDISAAIDAFFHHRPDLKEIVLWGLCDGASAALMHAARDGRIVGVAALNPWVSTGQSQARTYLRHYYINRLLEPGLWRKIGRGEFNILTSMASILGFGKAAFLSRRHRVPPPPAEGPEAAPEALDSRSIADKVTEGLERFNGRVLFVFSGNDLVASEFKDMIKGSRRMRQLIKGPNITVCDHPQADHTFSRRQWRDEVGAWTADWLVSW